MLEVSDLNRSVAFYRDVLSLVEVERWPEPRLGVWLSIGRNAVLGLWPPRSGGPGVGIAGARGGAHVHFALYVAPGSLPSWKARLESGGNQVEGPVKGRVVPAVDELDLTLEERPGGGTRMVIETRFPSAEAMEQLLAMGMEEGMAAAVGQIDDLLEAGPISR